MQTPHPWESSFSPKGRDTPDTDIETHVRLASQENRNRFSSMKLSRIPRKHEGNDKQKRLSPQFSL